MRIKSQSLQKGRLPLFALFMAGLLAGVLTMNFGKSFLLENTGLLDEYTLYHMKYMTVDSSALFVFVLKKRMGSALALTVLSTTYLGLLVCGGAVFWYGLSAGSFLAALMIRYGLKGLLLAVASVFPQYLLYVPAVLSLLLWCERLNRSIYFNRYSPLEERGVIQPGQILKFLLILGVLLLGCLLESFCNPYILLMLLKIF